MKKTVGQVYGALDDLVNNTIAKLAPELLVKTEHGVVIYNRYLLRRVPHGVEVFKRATDGVKMFGSSKLALVWVILDHNGRVNDALRVEHLGVLLDGVKVDITIHRRDFVENTGGRWFINQAKLGRDMARQRQFISEIDKYTILAQRLCQQKRTRT